MGTTVSRILIHFMSDILPGNLARLPRKFYRRSVIVTLVSTLGSKIGKRIGFGWNDIYAELPRNGTSVWTALLPLTGSVTERFCNESVQ